MNQPEGIQVITAAGSTSVNAGVGIVMINPASALATVALTLPASPADRDDLYIIAGGTITAGTAVTVFSIVTTVIGAIPTTMVAGQAIQYKYFQSTAKWYRIL
jgi:hypothetical protein